MRITKVYTRTGDGGSTSLVGGTTVLKYHERVEAYGDVDELNAHLGMLKNILFTGNFIIIKSDLERIQNFLFSVGADLATPENHKDKENIRIDSNEVTWLEERIDDMNDNLDPLAEFIIPGTSKWDAQFHISRTVCRRAERHAAKIKLVSNDCQEVVKYLNRLSDYLFVAGRYVSYIRNEKEKQWDHSKN